MQERLDEASTPRAFAVVDGYVDHPFLRARSVEAREFQLRIAERALRENTLVVVPTGLGKTLIAALVAAELLRQKRGTVLLLAPTRPLVLQHADTMRSLLRDEGLIHPLVGSVSPKERARLWNSGVLLTATPQTVRNDLAAGRYDLSALSLVIFDEAHRAVGDYAYVEISARLRLDNPHARVLALTASPGAKRERIQEVVSNLGTTQAEMRDPTSEDVSEYVQKVQLEPIFVELTPTLRRIAKPFEEILAEHEAKLRTLGVVKGERKFGLTKRELVSLLQSLGRSRFYPALYSAAMAHYARLCIDYVEVYGLDALKRYLDRQQARTDLKRNEKSFLNHPKTKEAIELLSKGIEQTHPKVDRLIEVLRAQRARKPDSIAIVFAQYRDALSGLKETLDRAGFAAERFIGQAKRAGDAGLAQDAQKDVLARFARREFPILLSTSVGEEGIDVPQVDLVAFYDAVPSEIRSIQRRGRTGRTVAGRVVLLVTKDSSDEGAYWAGQKREAKMKRLVSGYA